MIDAEEILRRALASFEHVPHSPEKWDAWVARITSDRRFLFQSIAGARSAYAFFLAQSEWRETAETERRRGFLHALLAVAGAESEP